MKMAKSFQDAGIDLRDKVCPVLLPACSLTADLCRAGHDGVADGNAEAVRQGQVRTGRTACR